MGIYLPNMEMPENCVCCDMSHEDGWCPAKQTYTDSYTFKTCPLVPVPPHGDLIDRDKLREKEFIHDGDAYAVVMSRDIRNAPTIIPASE